MKQLFVFFFALFFTVSASSQNNIAHTRISIITCGPGEEIYSLFGHTAIRIIDSTAHTDIVYNWGGFTFDQPNFYLKFLRGKLLYYSSADNFPDFINQYVYENRSVYEQVLDIDSTSKQKIITAINFNMQGDNRFYKYDFLFDNCTTRVKDIVFKSNPDAIIKNKLVPDKTTFRDMIHYYLNRGGQPWTKLGMDILLGSPVDRLVSNDEAMFLPEFFMKGLAEAKKQVSVLVNNSSILLKVNKPQNTSGKFMPLIILSIFSIAVFILSKIKMPWAITVMAFVDSLLLYVTGLIGIVILFMWFFTDHIACTNNFNLAWALPFNLPAAFCIIKKPAWLSNYFFITAVITAIFLGSWFWLTQQLNMALLPVVILLLNRYINLAKKYRPVA